MNCHLCHSAHPDDAKYCMKCGTLLLPKPQKPTNSRTICKHCYNPLLDDLDNDLCCNNCKMSGDIGLTVVDYYNTSKYS